MGTFNYEAKTYTVDDKGFLLEFDTWDENFAKGMSEHLKIPEGLTGEHWDVIHSIRNSFRETGKCPLVYETCRMMGLRLKDLRRLFPTGYLRGACKLAGITYKEGFLGQSYLPTAAEDLNTISYSKTYETDVRGFLVHPDEWDEYYAVFRAYDMKIPGGKLTEKHWNVIHFLRKSYGETAVVPTVYETCDALCIDLEELEKLFPDGYHRGAVKIAGLRVR
jgi:tRNA 2-thiouridine synthesizing protein E